MHITAVLALFADLPETELTNWIARGWVLPDAVAPDAGSADWEFHDIDVARVRLIHDLHRAMAIDDATMPLVLSLLDQIYDLRGALRDLLEALETQPAEVRSAVLATLRRDRRIG
jgi:chaperone modulatory protein CbpM